MKKNGVEAPLIAKIPQRNLFEFIVCFRLLGCTGSLLLILIYLLC